MFETGLQYVRADFHLHTHKDKEFPYSAGQNSFVNDYVTALKEADVRVGVITNHNKFDKDEYKEIQKAAKKQDIFILPGVELTVKEGANGVHTLIIFNPDDWIERDSCYIDSFLISAFENISNPVNCQCRYDLKDVFNKLDTYDRDYFVIFAHIDNNSGLLKECMGGTLKNLARLPSFKKRVLGLQKSHNYDNQKKFKDYFGYLPALVEGSDPKSIQEIGKGKRTYLKIGDYSYSAIKFALLDHKNRVSSTVSDCKHGYIDSISFQGGKFDEQTIRFSPELNTLIGIRGSGKSSILEAIRYVLGLQAETDKKYKDSLVETIFSSGGKATITIIDKFEKQYKVCRILGEATQIFDENEDVLTINPILLLDGIQYFGQQDLSSSTGHEVELLEKLVSGKINQVPNIDECVNTLITTVDRLLDMNSIQDQIKEKSENKTYLEHTLAMFQEKGVADKLNKQSGYTTDKTKIELVNEEIGKLLSTIRNSFTKDSLPLKTLVGYKSDFNKDVFEEVSAILSSINDQWKKIDSSLSQIESYRNDIKDILSKLKERYDKLADEFAEIKREIKDKTLNIDSFNEVTQNLVKVEEELEKLKKEDSSKSKMRDLFSDTVDERTRVLLETYNKYKTEVDHINDNNEKLHIDIIFRGDKEGFKSQMKEDFKGTKITDSKYQKICEQFDDYTAIIEDWIISDGSKLKKVVSEGEYEKLVEKLHSQYKGLLQKQVQNKVDFKYNGKLLCQLSIGQRASALLLFILTQNNNDVVFIDQPEDDLDNRVIYDEVITAVRQYKPKVQFIFATHNANIPVLGDSERVLVVTYQEEKINVESGNIDNVDTHEQIVDIMEGGKAAFEKRQLIYSSWQ